MKCVTYNIQYGKGRDGVFDLDRITREISGADVIALQEIACFWKHGGNQDQVAFFREQFSDHFCVYGPGIDLHIAGSKPLENKRHQFGNMILSKYPIEYTRNHLLPKRSSIGPLSLQRSALEATVRVNGLPLRIYSIHLTHLSAQTRLPQIDRILQLHRDAVYEGFPISGDIKGLDFDVELPEQTVAEHALLLGDFNFTPDGPEYEVIVGPICDYGGHITSNDGFVDAWCHSGGDKLAGATADIHGRPARLDYCFVSALLRNKIISCQTDTTATGSDHLPVWLELDI